MQIIVNRYCDKPDYISCWFLIYLANSHFILTFVFTTTLRVIKPDYICSCIHKVITYKIPFYVFNIVCVCLIYAGNCNYKMQEAYRDSK